jgi:hypothetical protein
MTEIYVDPGGSDNGRDWLVGTPDSPCWNFRSTKPESTGFFTPASCPGRATRLKGAFARPPATTTLKNGAPRQPRLLALPAAWGHLEWQTLRARD